MKHKDLLIDPNNPFKSCQLNRQCNANILSSILDNYSSGFVLAVNGAWGTGKTTFMQMWKCQLENQGHKTLYFNAWENDFVSEPMIGILGELKTLSENNPSKNLFKSIIDKTFEISTNIVPTLVKSVVKKHLGDDIGEILEKGTEATVDIFEKEINSYDKKKKSIKELKKDLAVFVKENCGNKPLVFIVDELDRCRPDYAVEVLEKIKHFFSVEGVVFVISIDKEQLGNSVRGYYGSDKINAEEYLRRFIDIEYNLPEPNAKNFCAYLYDYFEFDVLFQPRIKTLTNGLLGEKEIIITILSNMSLEKSLSLRQMEKIFVHLKLILLSFSSHEVIYTDLICLMLYFKTYKTDLYHNIRTLRLTIQELSDKIGESMSVHLFREEENHGFYDFILAVGLLFHCYVASVNRLRNEQTTLDLINRSSSDDILSFENSYIDNKLLGTLFLDFQSRREYYRINIQYITSKIDLLDNIIVSQERQQD